MQTMQAVTNNATKARELWIYQHPDRLELTEGIFT